MTYEEVVSEIEKLSTEKLKKFTEKLTPTHDRVYGARVPDLRALAKRVAAAGAEDFLAHEKFSLEEKMVHGFVLCYQKLPFGEFSQKIAAFAEQMDNWAVCDCVAATCKAVGKNAEAFLPVLDSLLADEKPFSRRFALVLLLDHYMEERWAEKIFAACDGVKRGEYYVDMAIAWLLSVCWVKTPEKTKNYLAGCALEEDILKKTARKILESRRVSEAEKQNIRKNGVK